MRLGIVFRSSLLVVLAAAAQSGSACSGSSAPASIADAPADAQAKIYRLQFRDDSVELARVGLDGRPPVQLAKHRVEDDEARNLEILALSQDRRQVLFGLDSSQGPSQQVLLFQTKDDRERKLLSFPRGTILFANFSPDGRQLAIYTKEVGVADAPRMGLYLVDTTSGKSRYLGTPGVAAGDYGFEPRWSRDGQSLFLGATAAYRVDLEHGRFEPARRLEAAPAWTCAGKAFDVEFNGRHVVMAPPVKPQSEVSCQSLASPGGLVASFDKDAVLWVESGGGERLRVLQAPHSAPVVDKDGNSMGPVPCGHTYGIAGWLGDRFLFFKLDDSAYVYDLQRRVSFEVPGGLEGDRFWW